MSQDDNDGIVFQEEPLQVAGMSEYADATVFTGLFHRAEIRAHLRQAGVADLYPEIARRKIMAECLRCEAEASLQSDLILVDRPVIDALGYLQAALQLSGRTLDSRRSEELMTIATAHTPDYDVLIRTALDSNIEVGKGRDLDGELRVAAATAIERLVNQIEPNALILTSANGKELVQRVVEIVRSRLTAVRPQ
jgi:hypothetical protein